MSDRSRALTSATTYQAIVIALVAAGIISIGVMSVCYRRRRREQWEQTVRAGLDRARHRHGYGDPLGVDGHGGEGVDLAEKPVMWDVDIGGKGEDWVPIRVGMDKDDGPTPWRPSMTPNSMIKAPEQPLSNTVNTNVELTILVAMPQPPFAPDQTRPLTDSSSSRPKSSTSLNSIDLKDPDADPFTLSELPHYSPTRAELDTEELPHVEIGTAVVPLSIRNAEDQEEVQEMRLGKMQSRAGIAGDWGRTQTQESNAR